jgi:hypothetical protein
MKELNWQTIPLGKYAQIDALLRHETTDMQQRDITILNIITGKPELFYETISLTELGKYRIELNKFLAIEPKAKFQKKFKCNGRRYSVSASMDEFNGGQLEGISMLKITPENFASVASKAMAILCKEEKSWKWICNGELSPTEQVEEFEKYLPTSIAIGIIDFFFQCSQALYPLVLERVESEVLKLKKQMEEN